MKKSIINLCFLLLGIQGHAAIRTVSNSPSTLAQYSTIQAAVDASSDNDIIYVHASSFQYPDATINNKKLTILGAGWSPQTNPNQYSIVGILRLTGTAHGTTIQGMRINGYIFMPNINDIKLIRNYFESGMIHNEYTGSTNNNLLVEGNYVANGSAPGIAAHTCCASVTLANSLFINNVLISSGQFFQNVYTNNNVVLDHNLFYGTGPVSGSSSNNFIFKNNIFVNCNPTGYNSTWQNNITYNCGGTNAPWASGTNVDLGGNIANQNPQIVDQVAVNANTNNPLLDFTISSGPANDAATDGKDMGLLFDTTGFLNWANSRNPKLPVVNNLVINSTAVPGGNLEINLKATQAK